MFTQTERGVARRLHYNWFNSNRFNSDWFNVCSAPLKRATIIAEALQRWLVVRIERTTRDRFAAGMSSELDHR